MNHSPLPQPSAPDHTQPLRATRELQSLLSAGSCSIHLVGIGGVGMAGLAMLLHQAGHRVSGSDLVLNDWTTHLSAAGLRVSAGQNSAHLAGNSGILIRSTAIRDNNPEVCEALRRGWRVFWRGEALPALANARDTIAITGTHGKTTTTAMTAWTLRFCGIPCGYAVGGETSQLGFIADSGACPWLVAEADESDGTIVHYTPKVAVVTNIEFDHMEHFGGFDELRRCFGVFWHQARVRIACADDPSARMLLSAGDGEVLSYGFSSDALFRGEKPVSAAIGSHCRVFVRGADAGTLRLAVPGRHNLQNALAAITSATTAGIPPKDAMRALADFRPVARRFEMILRTPSLTVVSDYAHHPTEIRTVVEMARTLGRKRLVAVFQPHRYTRTLQLGPDFAPAFEGMDHLILAPVYAASEDPLPGGTSADLASIIRQHGRTPVELTVDLSDAWARLRTVVRPGDAVLILGAGDISSLVPWARKEWAFSV